MKITAATYLLAVRQSSLRRHDLYSGFYIEHERSCIEMLREKTQMGNAHKDEISKLNRKSDSTIVVKKFL